LAERAEARSASAVSPKDVWPFRSLAPPITDHQSLITSAVSRARQPQNPLKLLFRERHHRKPRLPQQRDLREFGIRFDSFECYRGIDWPYRLDLDRRPISVWGRWVGECLPTDNGNPNYRFTVHTVIVKHLVTRPHCPKIVPGLKIPNPGPIRSAVSHKLIPGIGSGFLLNQPVLTHFCKYSGIPQMFEFVCLS
jgi:hypothetical protein